MNAPLALSLLALVSLTACDADGPDGDEALPVTGTPAVKGALHSWTFDDTAPNALPSGYTAVLGTWGVQAEASAPSGGKVLRQTGALSDPDFPRVLAGGPIFTDFTVTVRCRPESGRIDRACGLMLRAKDSQNYFLTRANALENNVRFYKVVSGNRQQLASADLSVSSGEWHTLSAALRGTQVTVKWDGAQVLTSSDATFASGGIGLWTKADSVTAFDDLQAVEE